MPWMEKHGPRAGSLGCSEWRTEGAFPRSPGWRWVALEESSWGTALALEYLSGGDGTRGAFLGCSERRGVTIWGALSERGQPWGHLSAVRVSPEDARGGCPGCPVWREASLKMGGPKGAFLGCGSAPGKPSWSPLPGGGKSLCGSEVGTGAAPGVSRAGSPGVEGSSLPGEGGLPWVPCEEGEPALGNIGAAAQCPGWGEMGPGCPVWRGQAGRWLSRVLHVVSYVASSCPRGGRGCP